MNFLMLPLVICLSTVLIQGCTTSSKNDEPEYTIGFSQCIGSDEWRRTMLDEMKRELSFYPGVKLLYEDAEGNSKKQIGQVKEMLRKKIDLLIISPNEARPLTPVVEEAFNRGIPVIIIDRKISSNLYTSYVGGNNFEIGRMAAEYIAGKLNGKGKILEVMGLPGSSPAIERQRGFNEGISKYPGVHIAKQVYGNWLKREAEKEVAKVISVYQDIDVVFAHNDQMALGSYQALKRSLPASKIKIVGVDALPGASNGLRYVSDGILYASMLYPTGGKEAIRTALAILNHMPFDKENILKTLVVDSSNVQLMKLQSDKINSQQIDIERQQEMLEEQRKIYHNQQIFLNILVVSLVLAIVFGGVAFYALNENWKNNKALEIKNEEIIKQQQQLIEMSAKAKAASEAKFNFFTNISHEFRTPLTLIMTSLEDLFSDSRMTAGTRKPLYMISKNASRLLKLINQLVDFRKIEYDKMSISVSENNIISFISEIMSSFKEVAHKRNIDIRLVSRDKELNIWFDVNMLDKVIFNLLSNAFKFTNDNGRVLITISSKPEEGIAEIVIEDNGIGMSEEAVSHAFDLFYQGDTDRSKGSGIGLSLSREIVILHKGTVTVNSTKGKGTAFKITLPLGDNHIGQKEKIYGAGQYMPDEDTIRLYTAELKDSGLSDHHEETAIVTKEHSVLIIEDNDDMRQFLQEKLSEHYEVYTAANSTEGLHEAFEKIPDLIISDVVMPGQSGTQLTQILKNDIRASHIPIILLSARANPEQQLEGIKALADTYITKPFKIQFLLEAIRNLLNNRQLLRSRYTSELPVDARTSTSGKLDKKFLTVFSGIVESNISNENLNVEDICKSIGISRVQLYRKVKALLGCSVSEYIINKRLKKAKYLLLNEDLSIAEITYKVGISSPTYFSTLFKAKYGCTPSEFKRKNVAEKLIHS